MACESVDWSDWVTWGFVLAGWTVVHLTQLSHERRKENREEVTRVIDELKEIERQAVAFHVSESYSAQESNSLIWRVGRLNRRLQRCPINSLEIPVPLMVRFKKAVILNNTDSSSFVTQAYHGNLIIGIRQITDEMIEILEAGRDRVFK